MIPLTKISCTREIISFQHFDKSHILWSLAYFVHNFDYYHNLVMISHSINLSIVSLSIINLPQICPHIDLKNLLYFVNFLLCSNFVGADAQWPATGASKTFSVHVRLSFQHHAHPGLLALRVLAPCPIHVCWLWAFLLICLCTAVTLTELYYDKSLGTK